MIQKIFLKNAYRCEFGNHDVLINLLTNWDDFYWLTGEFPPTFNMILNQIGHVIPVRRGPQNVLDLENQVILIMSFFLILCKFLTILIHILEQLYLISSIKGTPCDDMVVTVSYHDTLGNDVQVTCQCCS